MATREIRPPVGGYGDRVATLQRGLLVKGQALLSSSLQAIEFDEPVYEVTLAISPECKFVVAIPAAVVDQNPDVFVVRSRVQGEVPGDGHKHFRL